MPVVHVELLSGRSIDEKRQLVRLMTDAIVTSLRVDPKGVKIHLHEIEEHQTATAGVLRSDRMAASGQE